MKLYFGIGKFIGKNVAWLSLVMVSLGVLFPEVLDLGTPFVVPLFAFMTFQNSLTNRFVNVANAIKHPLLMLISLAISAALMPCIAFVLAQVLFGHNINLVTGIVLEYSVPIAVVAIMWVGMFKGNSSVALATLLVSTVASPLTIPLTLKILLGQSVQVDVVGMFESMFLQIALPALLGVGLNDFLKGKGATKLAPALAPASRMVLLSVIGINAVNISQYMRNLTPQLVGVMVFIGLFATTGYFWGFGIGTLLKRSPQDKMSLTYLCGMRNISAGAVLAAAYFPPEVMFPVMIGTLFQQVIAGMFGSFFRKHYGDPDSDAVTIEAPQTKLEKKIA